MAERDSVPFDGGGSNPFPFDSPFLDVMSRLGFTDTEKNAELESFWWFMGDPSLTPDDVASAIMKILPEETEKEAFMRRVGLMANHEAVKVEATTVRKRVKKK